MSPHPQTPPNTGAPPRRRRVLVVLGMHRGGTSAVAGVLHRLGVDLGPRLMPANADNPSGYYEHNDVVNLHDRFLLRLGAAWDAVFPPEFDDSLWNTLAPAPGLPTYREELLALLRRDFIVPENANPSASPSPLRPWGLKDPRLCLLLPWWEPVWQALDSEPLFLIVLRSPNAVAASLHRRDGFSGAKSSLLWLQYLLRAERFTRGCPRCFLNYDAFLDDWQAALRSVASRWGENWTTGLTENGSISADFLDPALRHHPRFPQAPMTRGEELLPWADAAWKILENVHATPLTREDFQTLDGILEEVSRVRPLVEPLLASAEADLTGQLAAQRRLTRWYEEEWQKARRDVETFRDRLTKQQAQTDKLRSRSR